MKKLTLIAVLLSLTVLQYGCEYQSKTERRVAFFYKDENGGDIHKSRDIGNSTQKRRRGNKVDHWLRRNISDQIK
jgi:hypothetical protein